MTDSITAIAQVDPSEYTVKQVPDINTLESVGPIPVPTQLAEFRNSGHETISVEAARQIISEMWRLYRNPFLLEVEKKHRDDHSSDLNIEWLSHKHIDDGVLDPTAVAKDFRQTVLEHHSVSFAKLSSFNADSDTTHSDDSPTVSV